MKRTTLIRALTLACTMAALAGHHPVQAQAWPAKPVRLLVPFGPGSGTDIVARLMAEGLTDQLKVPVIVENREGAGGVIGTQAVARLPADGYTVLAISNAYLIAPQMVKAAPYDPIRDFLPLAKVVFVPLALVVGASSPFRTMKDLLDYMKANPGKASFATSGKGAQSHLEVEYIKQVFGLNAVDVPYKSTAAAVADTISNTVAFYLPGYGPMAPHIAAGRVRALAIGAPARLPAIPDVPTFIEALGIPNYIPAAWLGYMVVAGTPADVAAKLEEGITRAVANPAVRDKIQATGAFMNVVPAREFGAEMRAEAEKWGKLINALGLRTD